MTTKRRLTEEERHINRLRRKFEKTPTHGSYTLWLEARDTFRFTVKGANAYRHAAMEALIAAREYKGGQVYADGYAYAKALLDNAVLLEHLVSAKRAADRLRATARPAVSLSLPTVTAQEDFHEEVKSFLLISA